MNEKLPNKKQKIKASKQFQLAQTMAMPTVILTVFKVYVQPQYLRKILQITDIHQHTNVNKQMV